MRRLQRPLRPGRGLPDPPGPVPPRGGRGGRIRADVPAAPRAVVVAGEREHGRESGPGLQGLTPARPDRVSYPRATRGRARRPSTEGDPMTPLETLLWLCIAGAAAGLGYLAMDLAIAWAKKARAKKEEEK